MADTKEMKTLTVNGIKYEIVDDKARSSKVDKVVPTAAGNVATLNASGNVVDSKKKYNPDAKSSTMLLPVGVDANGKLWVDVSPDAIGAYPAKGGKLNGDLLFSYPYKMYVEDDNGELHAAIWCWDGITTIGFTDTPTQIIGSSITLGFPGKPVQISGSSITFGADIQKELFLAAHPVGSYYWSSVSTSPASLFGGTWVQIKDRFVLAAGDNYKVGNTGGEAEHVLTVAEMPSHDHGGKSVGVTTEAENGGTKYSGYLNNKYNTDGTYTFVNSQGGGEAHNNMPPYIVAYCWRRTA